AQPYDDGVLVSPFAEQRGLRAGDVRGNRIGHARTSEAEQRRLGAIDADGELGAGIVTIETRVGDAGHAVQKLFRRARRSCRLLDILTANLELEPSGAASASASPPAPGQQAIQLLVAARGIRADDRAGHAGQLPAQVDGDLFARARSFIFR